NHFLKGMETAVSIDQGQQGIGMNPVDLVHHQENGGVDLLEVSDDEAVPRSQSLLGVHQKEDQVHLFQGGLRRLNQTFPQLRLGFVDARRIQEDDLPPLVGKNASDLVARRL